jgi:hypothetical protein
MKLIIIAQTPPTNSMLPEIASPEKRNHEEKFRNFESTIFNEMLIKSI